MNLMQLLRLAACLLIFSTALSAQDKQPDYRKILETKYQTSIERLQVIEYSERTHVLWFDFQMSGEKSWWAGINVVELGEDGNPTFWHDIREAPSAAGIERVRVVELDGKKHLEVIDCSHMGNGALHLYSLRNGGLHLLVECRAMTNLLSMHFSPAIAEVTYRDEDGDGDQDLIVEATCLKGQILDQSDEVVGKYRRVYHQRHGQFIEQHQKRKGASTLMD